MRTLEEIHELRERAVELRLAGKSVREIRQILGPVGKGILHEALPGVAPAEWTKRPNARRQRTEAARQHWLDKQARRDAHRAAERDAAATRIGRLTDRELLIAGVIAYWCEGTKSKPYQRREQVVFMNSDPGLIRFFLRFLDGAGVPRLELTYRVYIHETANVARAEQFWLELTGAKVEGWAKAAMAA